MNGQDITKRTLVLVAIFVYYIQALMYYYLKDFPVNTDKLLFRKR